MCSTHIVSWGNHPNDRDDNRRPYKLDTFSHNTQASSFIVYCNLPRPGRCVRSSSRVEAYSLMIAQAHMHAYRSYYAYPIHTSTAPCCLISRAEGSDPPRPPCNYYSLFTFCERAWDPSVGGWEGGFESCGEGEKRRKRGLRVAMFS